MSSSTIMSFSDIVSSSRQFLPSWAQVAVKRGIMQYRLANSQSRVLPDFLIVGAMKAGTTSLYAYLAQHPQLVSSIVKEVHYFDGGIDPEVDAFAKGSSWYRSNFPLKTKLRADQKVFEASPFYLFNPITAERISNLIPGAKIIAILRNPTERAISHYFQEKRVKREQLPILDALQAEDSRLSNIIEDKNFKHESFIHFSYKKRGLYKEQIERYFKCFPRENILILNSEHFFSEPADTLQKVCNFIGVETENLTSVVNLKPKNVAGNRTKVDQDVYDYLNDYFQPYNQELYKLIGEDYNW